MNRISILTPSFNQGSFIEQNIRSVLDQAYPDFEHIVIDGGSRDATLGILKRYPHLVWVSEPDRGQADALNKALARATGELVGWLNSDDYYAPGIFFEVAAHFEDPAVDWIVGDLTTVREPDGRAIRYRSPAITYQALIRDPDIVRQPSSFFRRRLLAAAGGWNPALDRVMDFDLWLRLATRSRPLMVPGNYAFFRLHPHQKTTSATIAGQQRELLEVLAGHHAPRAAGWLLRLRRWCARQRLAA